MNFIASARPVPEQHADRIQMHALRFRRAADALRIWSDVAKRCVDYFEGRQWSASDLAKLQKEKRPALVINKILPLVNLVIGYHVTNATDIKYLPGHDGSGTAEIAAALSQCEKQASELYDLPYVDSEVFLDGLLTGRGFYDDRLGFEHNDLGIVRARAADPFSVYPDPDADNYDLNTGNFIMSSRWVSPEEVETAYGQGVADMVGPFMHAGGVVTGFPTGLMTAAGEVSPMRRFSRQEDETRGWSYSDYFSDFIDAQRKAVRLLDIQHYIRVKRWFFVDLETGDTRPVPDEWTQDQVKRALTWAQAQGEPIVVQQRQTRRLRWTHMIGDVIAYDAWSPYRTFTITPFFPYFRRGMTRGMVEPLLDPQDEVNKRRSARLNIIARSAAGGWKYPKGSLDAVQKRNLEIYGSTPGVHIEYDTKGGTLGEPKPIETGTTPVAMSQLEHEAEEDLKKISGINDAALGMIDSKTISGAAIERRQRQTIVGLEGTMASWRRTKQLQGRKRLEITQDHYTEERIVRAQGRGSTPIQMQVNQRTAAGIVNDLSLGTYSVAIDEAPLSKSFLEAQFEELMSLKQMGMPVPDDFLIDASSVARKDELKQALAQARMQQAALATAAPAAPGKGGGGGGPGPGGSAVGRDGGSMPANQKEPGAPVPSA
jgi:hypothetical protein